jgi:DNA invertase Pin-like site-specific DNA recombinase
VPPSATTPVRVVTYARVSTKMQADRGKSLDDQEARFTAFIERTGAIRVQAYAEARSAGTVLQRKTFLRMFEELPSLGADALVIDSLDRFTRDKFLGAEQFGKLREMGVKLWELEYEEDRPLDLTRDSDRDYIWQKFSDAEAERRRIKKRQKKRYEEQRKRGAATTNRPGFGLLLTGPKGHKRLEPDPATAPIVQEVDRRILAGESQRRVIEWVQSVAPLAWASRRGLSLALLDDDDAYVKAGVRTPETQAALRALHGQHRQVFGYDRVGRAAPSETGDDVLDRHVRQMLSGHVPPEERQHGLSGLVACGLCADAIGDPRHALMMGRYIVTNPNPYTLVCKGVRARERNAHGMTERFHDHEVHVSVERLRPLIVDKLAKLRDPAVAQAVLAAWRDEPVPKKQRTVRESIERRLADLDDEEAALDRQVRGAMRLAASDAAGVAAEAERVLAEVNADRLALKTTREGLHAELARLPVEPSRAAQVTKLQRLLFNAEGFADGWRLGDSGSGIVTASDRELLKPWVDVLGPPIFRRPIKYGKRRLSLSWPLIDSVRPAPAPDYDVSVPA